MAFNWPSFFSTNGVAFSESGKNVSTGNIVTRCPWCGSADQGMHLSVSIDGRGYRCFRNPQHRGKNPAYLISKLTGLSFEAASAMAGNQVSIPTDFMARINGLLRPEPDKTRKRVLRMPEEFRHFNHRPSCMPYRNYLARRGFGRERIDGLTRKFDLRYCTRGPFSGRIIFPITYEGELVNWTGRTVSMRNELRYRTLTDNAEKAEASGTDRAIGPITDYLLWYDQLMEADADTIYIHEGPFDGLKTWYLGHNEGIVATCLFTIDISPGQIDLLHELLVKFKNRYLMLDRKTTATAIRLQSRLSGLGVSIRQVPDGFKDPGELDDIRHLMPLRRKR